MLKKLLITAGLITGLTAGAASASLISESYFNATLLSSTGFVSSEIGSINDGPGALGYDAHFAGAIILNLNVGANLDELVLRHVGGNSPVGYGSGNPVHSVQLFVSGLDFEVGDPPFALEFISTTRTAPVTVESITADGFTIKFFEQVMGPSQELFRFKFVPATVVDPDPQGPSAVPLPAGGVLLLSAFGLIAGTRRRTK